MVEEIDREFGDWIVTVEQADAIAAGDREALNKFYFDNYDGLKGMAIRYLQKRGLFNNFDDTVECMMNNLYLDLPLLSWENGISITADIVHYSFNWYNDEGYAVRKSQGLPVFGHIVKGDKRVTTYSSIHLNPNIMMRNFSDVVYSGDDELTLGDTLQAPKEDLPYYNYIDCSLSAKEICGLLSSYFNERELKVLEGMLEGYTSGDLRKFVGCSENTYLYYKKRIHQRLVFNYKEILSLLENNGVCLHYLKGIVPPDYEEIVELSANKRNIKEPRIRRPKKQRSAEYRHAEYMRRKERRKALPLEEQEKIRAKQAQCSRESRARKKAREAAQAAGKETPSESGTV